MIKTLFDAISCLFSSIKTRMVDRRWGSPLSSSSSSFPSSSFPFPYDHPRWGAAASSSNSDDEDSSVVLVSHLYLATAGARDSGVYTW